MTTATRYAPGASEIAYEIGLAVALTVATLTRAASRRLRGIR